MSQIPLERLGGAGVGHGVGQMITPRLVLGLQSAELREGVYQSGRLGLRPAGAASALIDISLTGPLLSSPMSVIAQAIADRQSEIDRLQAEIKALTDVEEILRHGTRVGPHSSRRRTRT